MVVIMTCKLSLHDLSLNGKRVLMRVDFNVPMSKQGTITDDSRIRAALPSIQYVLDNGGALILMSHLGRPKDKPSPEFSLTPVAKRLSELLKHPVIMAPDCIGSQVSQLAKSLKPGQVLMLENLRFHPGEEHPKDHPEFVKELASLGDIYVNDAFGTAHRAHASTFDIAKFFPGKAAAGFLMEKEIDFLGNSLLRPKCPFYALLGGAKISSKIGVLHSLIKKANKILIGGGMAYTFFKAQGIPIGNSLHEDDLLDQARDILAFSQSQKVSLLLPQDVVIAERIDNTARTRTIDIKQGIPDNFMGVDIGPKTVERYITEIQDAATVFWNGPMGVFEVSNFAKGTNAIANALAKIPATTIVGGGESVAALEASGVGDKISHISTGGGAALEYIEFGTLPGIEALTDKLSERVMSNE